MIHPDHLSFSSIKVFEGLTDVFVKGEKEILILKQLNWRNWIADCNLSGDQRCGAAVGLR